MFGINLSDFLNVPWEQGRNFIAEELQQMKSAISNVWGAAFQADGTLKGSTIDGDQTIVPQYVSNTSTQHLYDLAWSKIDLANGVAGRLTFAHLPTVSAGVLLGRGVGAGSGNIQEITLGTGLSMTGTTLNATADANTSWVPLALGTEPLSFVSDGAGHPIFIAFTP